MSELRRWIRPLSWSCSVSGPWWQGLTLAFQGWFSSCLPPLFFLPDLLLPIVLLNWFSLIIKNKTSQTVFTSFHRDHCLAWPSIQRLFGETPLTQKGFCWLGTSALLAVPSVYPESLENYKVPSGQMIAVFPHIFSGVHSVACRNISFFWVGGGGE